MRTFEIFWRFLLLGCTSFGGPAAHIGYYRTLFVDRLGWLPEETFGRLMALSQFLPGPGSSQLGFSIGCHRCGTRGGVAAFVGFTLPSFWIMYFLSVSSSGEEMPPFYEGVIHGLKLLAVVVVADATYGMFRSFCRGGITAGLCITISAAVLLAPGIIAQIGGLLFAAGIGTIFLKGEAETPKSESGGIRWLPLAAFAILFLVLPFWRGNSWIGLFSGFYQAGSLVFGGGHVVLPLLQNSAAMDGMADERFLLGYAGAQGVPGPMFTLASFLGAELKPDQALAAAGVATVGIFLPGFLLVLALKDAWESLAALPRLSGAVSGLNAAVVGLLLSALYRPVFTSSVAKPTDFVFVVLGFYLLKGLKLPVIAVVLVLALAGGLLAWFNSPTW
jgi:chromate transporter